MASYSGIHVENIDTARIAEAIEQFERDIKKRKVNRVPSTQSWVNSVELGKAGFFVHAFCIGPPVDTWTEIITSSNPWDLEELYKWISKELQTRVAAFSYQSTVGQSCFHLCDRGETVRNLSFTRGEPVYDDEGKPLGSEVEYREKQRLSMPDAVMREEFDDWESMDESAKRTLYFPDCEDFAEWIGCSSFIARNWHLAGDASKGICITSKPKWWLLS